MVSEFISIKKFYLKIIVSIIWKSSLIFYNPINFLPVFFYNRYNVSISKQRLF